MGLYSSMEEEISIHALRGEGDGRAEASIPQRDISIHALRGEGDNSGRLFIAGAQDFYPRPPWGGRPGGIDGGYFPGSISIHALRGEGDYWRLGTSWRRAPNFYPRPPWGGRPGVKIHRPVTPGFLSTPSVGRATGLYSQRPIHDFYFYPRPPWGGRRAAVGAELGGREISIHALRGEGDRQLISVCKDCHISIHALRGEGDRSEGTA